MRRIECAGLLGRECGRNSISRSNRSLLYSRWNTNTSELSNKLRGLLLPTKVMSSACCSLDDVVEESQSRCGRIAEMDLTISLCLRTYLCSSIISQTHKSPLIRSTACHISEESILVLHLPRAIVSLRLRLHLDLLIVLRIFDCSLSLLDLLCLGWCLLRSYETKSACHLKINRYACYSPALRFLVFSTLAAGRVVAGAPSSAAVSLSLLVGGAI